MPTPITPTHDAHTQACNGLEETGVADVPTWMALLGAEGYQALLQGSPTATPAAAPAHGPRQVIEKWPTLHEGDGGRFVHALHVLLERAGCWPGEDDFQWWWFGDSTLAALKAYQVCHA